ncbi:MAG: hypothetical protein HKO65_17075 [Gemmatimonadetes bacterium]|nr:TonB C-terminal domain-containing protein [Gemmatimonadota bacterium]NNM06811.1 hypothetical protein [Gemmatimonadota bacterium]
MRRRERPGKKSLYASAGVHVVAVVLAWLAQVPTSDPSDFLTYQITYFSPPPAEEAPEPEPVVQEEVAVETPEPIPDDPPPVVQEETRVEERPEPTPTPAPPDPVEEAGDPEPSEEISGEDLNIRMEGLRRDFPDYYLNIQRQIQRCFEYRGGGRLETSIIFQISRDGTVDGGTIDFYERSGNVNFDYAAMGAVECAGAGRFGPLPEDLGWDRLPILFTFRPRGSESLSSGTGASPDGSGSSKPGEPGYEI